MALLDGGARSATAIAARPSTLLRVSGESLDQLFRDLPGARTKYLGDGVRILSERLRSSNRRYWDLADRSVRAQMEASESRARLLSLVSHELRTPLTAIKACAQLIHRGAAGREPEFAAKIVRETDRLRVLTEDLIALCLLQSGMGAGEESELDLQSLIAEVTSEISGRADGASVSVVEELADATVVADRGLLRRAVHHIVENAVRFSPPGGSVRVELDHEDTGAARIRVSDRGPGVDPEALERLRRSFVQDQDPLNRDVEGLGIGLPLAHEVMKALGGSLTVDASPGEGTRVTLVLPALGALREEAREVAKAPHG
jgi:signal transduction histidine kinase